MASAGDIKAGRAYVQVSTDDRELQRGLLKMSKQLDNWSKRATGLGMKVMAGAAAMALPFASSLVVYGKFALEMSKVAAISKASATELKSLREQAIELGKTTFFTTSQVANAQKYLAMAGFNPEQILGGLKSVLDLALAGDMDIGVAADIATNISTPFKIAARDISRVSDVLAAAATSSNTTVIEMGDAFKYAAAGAASSNQTIEEVGAAMSILANNGIKASMAGTSIRKMFSTLSDTGVQNKLKDMFNIDVVDHLTGEMRPLLSIMSELGTALQKSAPTERAAFLFDLFGERAGNSAVVLTNAADMIAHFRNIMEGANGAAAGMAATMADNLGGDWVTFMSAVEGVQIAIGDAFNGMARNILQSLTFVSRGIASWITENQTMAIAAGAAVIGVGALGASLIALGITLKLASVGLAVFSVGIGLLSGAINMPIRLIRSLTLACTILGKTMFSTRAASAVWAAGMIVIGAAARLLQGILVALRVTFLLLQAGMYAVVAVAYASYAALTGLRAAFYAIYASSQIAYVGMAVFQGTLRMLSGTVIAVSFNFRAWVASLFAARTATQAAGTAMVVYNATTRSSSALALALAASTRLISGGMGSVAGLTRSAGTALVVYTTGIRAASGANSLMVVSTNLVRVGFTGVVVATRTAGAALVGYVAGLRLVASTSGVMAAAQVMLRGGLTGLFMIVFAGVQAFRAMTMAASVASVRLLFFRAGTLAVQAGASLMTARMMIGRSAMLTWSATCIAASAAMGGLAVASKLAGLALLNVLLIPLLKIGLVVGAGIAIWYLFGDTIKTAFSTAVAAAGEFFGWLGSGLQTLWTDFSKYMGMIGDLLLEGNISEAAKLVWELIQLEWEKGCLAISQRFGQTIDKMKALFNEFIHEFNNFWQNNKRGDSMWGGIVARLTSLSTGISYEDIVADMNRQAEHGLEQNALSKPKTEEDYRREREEQDQRHQAKIGEIQGRLEQRKADHDAKKERERQELDPDIELSETDIELTKLKIELNDAVQAKDQGGIDQSKESIAQAKQKQDELIKTKQIEAERLEYEKAVEATQKAKAEFETAIAALETAKKGNNVKAVQEAMKRTKKASDDVESAIGHENVIRNRNEERQRSREKVATEPQEMPAPAKPKVDLTELKIKLSEALISGDKTQIESARKAVNEAELEKAKEDCLNAAEEYRQALKEVEKAKETGNMTALAAANERSEKAADKVSSSQNAYESLKERVTKGMDDTKEKFSVSGTFSAAAARNMGVTGYQQKIVTLAAQIVANTDPGKQKADKAPAANKQEQEAPKREGENDHEIVTLTKEQNRLLRDLIQKAASGLAFS